MSYISKDEQILIKISKYMDKLEYLYSHIQDLSDSEIDEGIEGLALAQCVTNLFELAIRLENDEVAEKLSILSSGRTARLRNINSHDYDAVDWVVAKDICRKILAKVTTKLLGTCTNIILQKKHEIKDYNSKNKGE